MLSTLVKAALLVSVTANEWTIDPNLSATIIAGVGAATDELAVAGASSNGIGAFNAQYDGANWAKNKINGGMLLDSAITKSGVAVATSTWFVYVATDNGSTFNNVTGVNGVSQNANVYGDNADKLALVGTWATEKTDGTRGYDTASGVASSGDNGATWTISTEVPNGSARYGAFPTETTWFVSSGMWGEDPEVSAGVSQTHKMSSRLSVPTEGASPVSLKTEARARKVQPANKKAITDGDVTGWFGSVAKTTDAGKTWTKVFETDLTNDYLYFNGIACTTESNCVVVAEGDTADGGYLTAAYTTVDGGASWTQTHYSTEDVSMMAATAVGDAEFWLAGTSKKGPQLLGQFYHSTDGGLTWALEQSLENCFPFDVDFADKVGYAACSSSSGASCSVAIYK